MIWWPEPEPKTIEDQGIQAYKNFCLPHCLPHETTKNGNRSPRGRVAFKKLEHRNELAPSTALNVVDKRLRLQGLDLSSDGEDITRCFRKTLWLQFSLF